MQLVFVKRFTVASLLVLAVAGSLRAQDQGVSSPASTAAVSADDVLNADAAKERMIYLPYEKLRDVFEKHGAAVFLPFQDYLTLWEQTWGKIHRPSDQPPVGGVISKAAYFARVEEDVVRIRAELDVQILKRGWAEVPVSFGDAAIASVAAEPGPVLLRGTGNGTYSLLFSSAGEHSLTIDLTARVRTAPEGRSFELQVPNVGITTFELTVPEADQTIELQPKLLQEKGDADGKLSQVRASLGSTDKVTAKWHPRVGVKPDMDLLASATNATLLSVEDGLIHADAHFAIEVLRGQVQQLRVAVPKGQRVLDVSSAARIREWTIAEEENRQVVTVELLGQQSGKIQLAVHTEWALTNEPFDAAGLENGIAHGIHLLDVLRESGQIALRVGGDFVLNVTMQQGLVRIDESEVDDRIKRPNASYFKFYNPQCRLAATAKPVQPRLLVDQSADVIISGDQIRLQSSLNYTIERAGLFELDLGVPAGMTIESVNCDGLKQYDVSADMQTLTIVLRESRQGSLAVSVVAIRPRDPKVQTEEFAIPLLEPRGVEVETGHLRILAPDGIEVITEADAIVGFQPDPAPRTEVAGRNRLVSAWTFSRRPLAMPAKTVLKPTRLTANVGTIIDVQQGQVPVATTLQYVVEYAGLDTFRFAVPESVSDSVQIQLADGSAPPIRQKSSGNAEDGWIPWTVVLQRETTGIVALRVTYDLTPPIPEGGVAEVTAVPLVRVLDPVAATDDAVTQRTVKIARITGEVTVRKDRALSVAVSAEGGDVEPIDVRELSQLPQDGFVAYRYYQQPVDVTVKASKYDIQPVVETVVSRGLVEAVLDRSGVVMVRGRYQTKSSERQRLRIDLPKGIEPLGAEVDGKSIALEKNPDAAPAEGWDAYYLNVARTKASDEQFLVSIQYRATLSPAPFQTRGGDMLLRFPMLGGSDAANVPVQQFRVALWVPDEFALVGTPQHFGSHQHPTWLDLLANRDTRNGVDDSQAWIGGSSGGVFDFPTEGHAYVYSNLGGRDRIQVTWWHLPFYTWIVSGALVIIAVTLRNTSWENKLGLLVLVAFVASAYALQDADLVAHAIAVGVYGLAAMLALWVIHGLFRRPGRRRTTSGGPPPTPPAAVIPPPGVFDAVTLGMQKS